MEQTKEKHDQYYEMAHAPVGRVISKLAVPTIISMLVTSIYNMADTFFVSRILGPAPPVPWALFFLPWPSSRHCPL